MDDLEQDISSDDSSAALLPDTGGTEDVSQESDIPLIEPPQAQVQNTNYTSDDPRLMDSLFGTESSKNPNAIGPETRTGEHALGIGQIMPATFKQYAKEGEEVFNEQDNKNVSQRVLKDYQSQFGGDIKLALAAYNAGPGTIKNYQKRTRNGTWDEVSAEMEKDNAYEETRKYVPKILGNYERKLGTQSPGLQTGPPQQAGALPQGRGTRKEFANTLLQEVSKPDFDTLSPPEQIKTLGTLYGSRKWEPDTYDTVKSTATSIWDTADPEEQPDFSEIVGVPPITPSDQNVDKSVDDWKTMAMQKVIKSGIPPALFGDQLDTYLKQVTDNEKEAFTARNRSTVGWALNRTGNLIREGVKGAVGMATGAVAGGVRLAGAPFGAGQETADIIENTPVAVLGVPARDFLYNTDQNGELVLNPDGTPQMHWQAQVAQGIGMIGGTIGTLGVGAELGVSSKVLAAANMTTNTLNMAGSSFKHVYNETGSIKQAYSAAAFAIPAAAVQSVGELGVVAGAFSPTLKGLSVYDKARYLAQSFTKNAVIGSSTTAAGDIIQQYGETRQTGEAISGQRTAIAAVTGGLGAGVAGGAFDYIRGTSSLKPVIKPSETINSGKELTSFRDSLEPTRVVNAKPESIKKSEADLLGITVTPREGGGVTLTKKTDIALQESYTPEQLPELIDTLNSQPTPREIETIAKEHGELASKPVKTPAEGERLTQLSNTLEQVSRPEYQNNIKAVENKVAQVLESDPGLLPVRRDISDHTWEHVETGRKAPFLKDLLKPEEIVTPEFTHDVSDISHIRILDEDTLQPTQSESPKAIATEEHLNLQRDLDKINAELLDFKNKKETLPKTDKEGRKATQDAIDAKTQEKRTVQSDQLKLKPTLDIELAEQETYTKNQRARDKDLKTINKIREKGLGAIVTSKGKSEIIIPKGLQEEAKTQITAHEIAHSITDKLNLSADTNLAIESKLLDLKDKADVTPASEMAKEVFLPEVNKNVKIPEGTTVKGLEKESQDALLSKREYLANQVGAIMLKRAGRDIGDYKILPELEEALSKTKLPEIGGRNEPKGTQNIQPERSRTTTQEVAKESPSITAENVQANNIPKENIPVDNVSKSAEGIIEPEAPLNPKTGETGETAFSKTVREEVPERPATEYEKVSRIKGTEEANKYIQEKGLEETAKLLQNKESFKANPEQRILLTDALLRKVKEEFNANPTLNNQKYLYEADQLRGAVGTSAGQQLALLQRFRNTADFADFITQVKKTYREAGFDSPEFTEFQLKELKAMYENAQGIPEGVLRNDRIQKTWEKAMISKKLEWPDFLRSYMQTNLLSGIGTGLINTAGGAWMGPLFTALSHPILGRGLVWKTMWKTLGVAKANARRVLEGKGANELYGGLMDPSAIQVKDTSTPARALASIYNKFGRGLHRVLSASDTFMRTTAGEGYIAVKKYKELQEKYANNPDKLYAEAGKIALNKDALNSAILQAEKEGKAVGLELSEADKMVRAYEIIRRADTSPELLRQAADWADTVSLRGDIANPIQNLLHKALYNSQIWNDHPLLGAARNVILPFGRAILKISDFSMDLVPGNIFIDKGMRYLGGKIKGEALPERSQALQDRLRAGQYIGTALAVTTMGLARSGLVQITGEEEQALGANKGEPAKSRKQFKESEQAGIPPYSIIFPGGFAISYKDLPGINAVLYGVHKANKAIDEGTAMPYVAMEFFRNSYASAVPFLGTGTLNSPYVSLVSGMLDPEATEKRVQDSFEKVATSVSKMMTPASSLLSDVKKLYDSTPEESNQSLTLKMFKDIPGVSELLGSKPALNRFGDPVERTALERIPGVGRLIEEVKTPSDEVARKLVEKGIIVPELGRTVKFNKSEYPNVQFQEKYEATRAEKVGKAYSNSFTPDEWYDFIKATGPHIRTIANQIASSSMPTAQAQELLIKRTHMIEDQAKKRFIRTGQF